MVFEDDHDLGHLKDVCLSCDQLNFIILHWFWDGPDDGLAVVPELLQNQVFLGEVYAVGIGDWVVEGFFVVESEDSKWGKGLYGRLFVVFHWFYF